MMCINSHPEQRPMAPTRTWVWASTRMTVQCFLSCSSSASMAFLPSAYFLT
jgi:hypothetical protein